MKKWINNLLRLKITNNDNLQELVNNINNQINVKENILKISKQVENYPLCTCGNPIYFPEMILSIKNDYLVIHKPSIFEHTFKDKKFNLCKCYNCVKEYFKNDMPSMQRYLFQIRYRWAKFIYNIPEEIHKEIRSDKCAVTLESCIRKHGEEKGKEVYEGYCKKQSESNKFEYKHQKHGWTKEQFDEYNKSRAVTKENLIRRHGEEKGLEIWDHYLEQQKLTKSWEYMVEKFGEEKAKEIKQSHAVTYEKFVNKYGVEKGKEKWEHFVSRAAKFYSNISQKFFSELDKYLNYNTYYATKNKEFCIYDDITKRVYMLDYYISDLKICIEFDGDVFHANPNKYNENDQPNPFNNFTAKEIWENDKQKQKIIENKGIKVIRIWESEYCNKNFDIKNFIKEKLKIDLI